MPSQLTLDLALPPPTYAREDFVVAAGNREAIAWIERWPDWPAPALALHGPAGCGKTHLGRIWAARTNARLLAGSDRFQRPGDRQLRVIPAQAAFAVLAPEVGGLVEHLGVLAQGEEAMGKTHRHPELLVVLGAEFSGHPLAEGGRAAAQIHRHIQDRAEHAAHELALGMGRELVVQAAQHTAAGAGVVVLHERGHRLPIGLER